MLETFAQRLRYVVDRTGPRGRGTGIREYARFLGIKHWKLHAWLRRDMAPQGGYDELAGIFDRLNGLGVAVSARDLAAWVFTGAGEPSIGGSRVPNVSPQIGPAQPVTLMGLRPVLESVKAGTVSVDEAEATIGVLARSAHGAEASRDSRRTPSSSCRSTRTRLSSSRPALAFRAEHAA